MTESLIHGNRESQSHEHLILQLEDAGIGDHYRIKSIKKTLSMGQELPEVDKQYLEEQIAQLQKARMTISELRQFTEKRVHHKREQEMIRRLSSHIEKQKSEEFLKSLEDAGIGDQYRLKSIKKTLSMGQELPEVDKQYLEEQIAQLQKTIDHQMMAAWEIDFVQKLRVTEKGFIFDEIEKSLEEEKNTYKIDKKLLARTSTQHKQMMEYERKAKWTLDLIYELKETKIGDSENLNYVSMLLKSKENVEKSDEQYLKEKAEHLKQIIDCKTKVMWTQDASRKLQENEMRHSKKLEEIKQLAENGKLVSEREQNYLNACYEKLQSALDQQSRIEWTIQAIQKMKEFGVGDSTKLDAIKQLLEDDMHVPEEDVKYLREEYELLRPILRHKKQIDWTVGMINELQETEIGNPERLSAIKKTLEERNEVPESEINYLKDKYRLLMMSKKSEKITLGN